MKQYNLDGRSSLMLAGMALMCAALGDARAVEVFRYDYQGAAGVCQPSLPEYEAGLRSRPLGLANEGTTTAFVTCTFRGDDTAGGRGAWQVLVNVANDGTTSQTVKCTLVDGAASGATSNATYTPKSAGLFIGGAAFIAWVPTDIAGSPAKINRPALSCALPAKTTLQYLGINYDENIGS